MMDYCTRGGAPGIWIMNADGTDLRPFVQGQWVWGTGDSVTTGAHWSAVGWKLAFTAKWGRHVRDLRGKWGRHGGAAADQSQPARRGVAHLVARRPAARVLYVAR